MDSEYIGSPDGTDAETNLYELEEPLFVTVEAYSEKSNLCATKKINDQYARRRIEDILAERELYISIKEVYDF